MNATASRLFALLLAPGALFADRLSFQNGDLVTGTILEMDAEDRIIVATPDAPAPLRLRADTLAFADFDQEPPEKKMHERVNLLNGDVLPGKVTAMDGQQILLQTWYAGDLQIPRQSVRSVDFGMAPSKLAYEGPGGPEGWLNNSEWRFTSTGISSTGRGTIARPKILPANFILRFKFSWISMPNLRFYFCDDLMKEIGITNRYYFELNRGGMQIKRQAADAKRTYFQIFESKRLPPSFDNNDVEIELRVDRTNRLLYVYIDGELEGRFTDLVDQVPDGSGIMLLSGASRDTKNIISSIEIFHWDAVSQLHRAEGHEDKTKDAIITTDSQRYPGDARELVTDGDERFIVLKNPHANDLLRVPVARTSVLYLRHEKSPTKTAAGLTLELANRGQLHLDEPRLQDGVLQGHHPMLGNISLKREALLRIQAPESSPTDSAP